MTPRPPFISFIKKQEKWYGMPSLSDQVPTAKNIRPHSHIMNHGYIMKQNCYDTKANKVWTLLICNNRNGCVLIGRIDKQ